MDKAEVVMVIFRFDVDCVECLEPRTWYSSPIVPGPFDRAMAEAECDALAMMEPCAECIGRGMRKHGKRIGSVR